MGLTRAIAIEFDGCLCTNNWPEIGEPNWPVIKAAIREQVSGASLILWTCRHGYLLSEAIEACERWGLTFDAVNENLPERLAYYGSESRKISADEYWDDHAVLMPAEPNPPLTLEQLGKLDGMPVWIEWKEESKEGWALVRVWSKVNNSIYLTYHNGNTDLLGFILKYGGKIYRRKPEGPNDV